MNSIEDAKVQLSKLKGKSKFEKMLQNLHVYVIGIEDIILDRLRACVHWKSSSDCEWGKRLYLMHAPRLDMNYLTNTSRKDNTFDKLNDWLNEMKE